MKGKLWVLNNLLTHSAFKHRHKLYLCTSEYIIAFNAWILKSYPRNVQCARVTDNTDNTKVHVAFRGIGSEHEWVSALIYYRVVNHTVKHLVHVRTLQTFDFQYNVGFHMVIHCIILRSLIKLHVSTNPWFLKSDSRHVLVHKWGCVKKHWSHKLNLYAVFEIRNENDAQFFGFSYIMFDKFSSKEKER